MKQIKKYRKHKYEDYEPDESNINWDKVKITPIYNTNDDGYIGYLSRYNTNKFRFEENGEKQEILKYKDWKIEYIK